MCSIGHPYHSMFTKDTDGNFKIADRSFLQEVIDANKGVYDEETEFNYDFLYLVTCDYFTSTRYGNVCNFIAKGLKSLSRSFVKGMYGAYGAYKSHNAFTPVLLEDIEMLSTCKVGKEF